MKKLLVAALLTALAVPTMAFAGDLAGDPVFKAKCAGCHGANGEGKSMMKTTPMKDAAVKSADALTASITNGVSPAGPGMKMPPYGEKLSAEQIKTLVTEIKALK